MKKRLSLLLLLFVIMFMLVPVFAKADLGAPEQRPVEMVVTNPKGLDYTDNSNNQQLTGHLKKDSIFSVIYEYDSEAFIIVGNDKEKQYQVKISDLYSSAAVRTKILDPTKESDKYIEKLDKPNNAIVYETHGSELRNGPSYRYDTITNIPKGTKLKYSYYINGGRITYIYVEYKGQKGWVEITGSKVLIENTSDQYIAINEVNMVCATIPRNTILKPTYKSDILDALFKYNDCVDLLPVYKSRDLVYIDSVYANAKADLDIYQYSNNEGNKLATIPNGARFIMIADLLSYDEPAKLYVSYNGVEGWVKADSESYERTNEKAELPNKGEVEDEKVTVKDIKSTTPETKNEVKTTGPKKAENFVLICVIIGLSVSLAAAITIMIINQKRNKKKINQIKTLINSKVSSDNKNQEAKEDEKNKELNDDKKDKDSKEDNE